MDAGLLLGLGILTVTGGTAAWLLTAERWLDRRWPPHKTPLFQLPDGREVFGVRERPWQARKWFMRWNAEQGWWPTKIREADLLQASKLREPDGLPYY